jgi:hypothetical protein
MNEFSTYFLSVVLRFDMNNDNVLMGSIGVDLGMVWFELKGVPIIINLDSLLDSSIKLSAPKNARIIIV